MCVALCVCDVMLHLFECYFTPLPLMLSVREQQHGSLTCHIVAWHCLMMRVLKTLSSLWGDQLLWRCSNTASNMSRAVAEAVTYGCFFFSLSNSHFIFFSLLALFSPPPVFHLNGLTLCPLLSSTKWIHAFIHCIQSQKRQRHKLVHA